MTPHAPIALVVGEPAGIGAEIAVKLIAERHAQPNTQTPSMCVLAVGDSFKRAWQAQSQLSDLPSIKWLPKAHLSTRIEQKNKTWPNHDGALPVVLLRGDHPIRMGEPSTDTAHAVIDTLALAADGCHADVFSAMVTGPMHKACLAQAGIDYTGTTEWLAKRLATQGHDPEQVVMMLANQHMRVALVTTHLPLRAVPDAITHASVSRCLRIVAQDLKHRFGIAKPRIQVLGLNPHAGEDGLLGTEDRDIVQPVIEQLRTAGMDLTDPVPADTAFLPSRLGQFDAHVSMYHDQALPVLKAHGLDDAINISLGLPIIRVAVDHGTALGIAGQGIASHQSLALAWRTASHMVRTQHHS